MPTQLELKRKELAAKQAALQGIFDESGDDRDFTKVKSIDGDTAAKISYVQQSMKELDSLFDEVKALDEIEGYAAKLQKQKAEGERPNYKGFEHPSQGSGQQQAEAKSLGTLWVESKGYEAIRSGIKGVMSELDIELRTVMRTGAGWAPEAVRLPRIELDPQRPIAVVDNIPQLPTSLETIRYVEETTFTNNAVETAEQTTQPTDSTGMGEAALAFTERTQAVEWLPTFIPVTMQQLEDVAGVEAYINGRLTYMLRARLDSQIIGGDGSTPNILGTNNVSGINTQALGADPVIDAIFKGIQLCRVNGFAEPSVIFMHPNDWEPVRILRTADGQYIMGMPSDPGVSRLWGVPVVQTTAATENTATLGDYRNFSALYTKSGIRVSATDSHGFNFTSGIVAIKAETRVAMVHFRPEAFTNVTGI